MRRIRSAASTTPRVRPTRRIPEMRRRFLIAGTAAALAAAVLGLGGVLHGGGGAAARGRPQADTATLPSRFASRDTARLVAQLQATLPAPPAHVHELGVV